MTAMLVNPPAVLTGVDLFCGAGGLTEAAERAAAEMGILLRMSAYNHWRVAINTHSTNHPDVEHGIVDLRAIRASSLLGGACLDFGLAAPTCTHFSRARGGMPTSDQQRVDPEVVLDWIDAGRPLVQVVENVPEIVDWGPVDLDTGRPIKERKGEYFRAWIDGFRDRGYEPEWRELVAADYGDPTTRKRFILIATRDGSRVPFPAPTHAPADRADLLGLLPWRGASEIIDWSIPGRSIFGRKKPLVPATLARLADGLARCCGPAANAFLVVLRRHAASRGLDLPLPTITTSGDRGGSHFGLAQVTVTPFLLGQHGGSVGRPVTEPAMTIAAAGALALVQPFICPYYGSGSGKTGTPIGNPLSTVTALARFGLVQPVLQRLSEDIAAGEDISHRIVDIDGQAHVVDILYRMLHWTELARAMSSIDGARSYTFSGTQADIHRQIGNAVPVRMGTAIMREVFKALGAQASVAMEAAE